jgi:hypothetical protein
MLEMVLPGFQADLDVLATKSNPKHVLRHGISSE